MNEIRFRNDKRHTVATRYTYRLQQTLTSSIFIISFTFSSWDFYPQLLQQRNGIIFLFLTQFGHWVVVEPVGGLGMTMAGDIFW